MHRDAGSEILKFEMKTRICTLKRRLGNSTGSLLPLPKGLAVLGLHKGGEILRLVAFFTLAVRVGRHGLAKGVEHVDGAHQRPRQQAEEVVRRLLACIEVSQIMFLRLWVV